MTATGEPLLHEPLQGSLDLGHSLRHGLRDGGSSNRIAGPKWMQYFAGSGTTSVGVSGATGVRMGFQMSACRTRHPPRT